MPTNTPHVAGEGSAAGVTAAAPSVLARYMPALDGLRGIAILWVISLHLPGQMEPSANPVARRGAVGVELFFAISGLLVTRSLYQCVAEAARRGKSTFSVVRDFAARRISRIWPPYFLTLAAAFAGLLLDPTFRQHSDRIREVFWAYPTFAANYVIPTHEPSLSLTVMWSLCFEEQFYVLLLLMYLVAPKRLSWLILVAALGSIVARFTAALCWPEVFHPELLTNSVMQMETHWRFDALAWGCLGWIFHERIANFWQNTRHRELLQSLLLVGSVIVSVPRECGVVEHAALYLLMAPLFTGLVLALAFSPKFWLQRLLSWPPLAWVGVISYEIYLSHVVVYRTLNRLHLDRWLLVYYAVCVTLALAVGWAFHRVFGKPTQRWVRAWLSEPRAPKQPI